MYYKWKLERETVGNDEYYNFSTDYDSHDKFKNAGKYILNLTIQDTGKNSFSLFYNWEIIVNNVNRVPQVVVKEPLMKNPKMKEDTSLQFSIEKSDPDPENDLETIWYFDDNLAQEGGDSYTYFADYAAAGEHIVRVEVDDGTNITAHNWNLKVEDVEVIDDTVYGLNWDQWSIIIEIIVIGITGLFALVGYRKIRKKKSALKIYLAELETVSEEKEKDPDKYEKSLNELEERIHSEFKAGKIEDLHYLILQEIIINKRGEVRKATVSKKFKRLPKGITKVMNEILKDSKISQKEYDNITQIISKTETLKPYEKKELSKMIEKWRKKDEEMDVTSIQKDTLPEEETPVESDQVSQDEVEQDAVGQDEVDEDSNSDYI